MAGSKSGHDANKCLSIRQKARCAINYLRENWIPTKRAKVSAEGIVVAQHGRAAAAGAEILAAGGNAVDAAVPPRLHPGVLGARWLGLGRHGVPRFRSIAEQLGGGGGVSLIVACWAPTRPR